MIYLFNLPKKQVPCLHTRLGSKARGMQILAIRFWTRSLQFTGKQVFPNGTHKQTHNWRTAQLRDLIDLEGWFGEDITDTEVVPANYSLQRSCRVKQRVYDSLRKVSHKQKYKFQDQDQDQNQDRLE